MGVGGEFISGEMVLVKWYWQDGTGKMIMIMPGLGAPLSSYLKVVLYKFHRQIDR